jgi:hypothetical protein
VVLDAWAKSSTDDLPDTYLSTLIAGHALVAIELDSGEVRTAVLDPDSLRAAIDAGTLRLSYRRGEDHLILIDGSDALFEALDEYIGRAGALGEPDVWRRVDGRDDEGFRDGGSALAVCFEPSIWPEADELFRRDPHWIGADGAYSVDLGDERTLWLFGDTWVDPSGRKRRGEGRMIRNSVAIQTGADPSRARIAFYWGGSPGEPGSFFPERGRYWFWPGHGIRLDDRLLLFLMRVTSSDSGLGFRAAGWDAVAIENPDDAPSDWRLSWLEAPANDIGVVVGSASVLRSGDYVYAFGSQEPVSPHPMYLVRWPIEEIGRGNLGSLEWWAGSEPGWVANDSSHPRMPAFLNGQSELTVHFDEATGQYLAIQTVGFGPADMALRAAPELTGPWTTPRVFYRPSEYYRPNVMIYAGKAHPQLAGADLVVTYATNTLDFAEQIADSLIYYPRFVRLLRCR